VLGPRGTPFKYLSKKGLAYLLRRKKWGPKVYGRSQRTFVGTLPKSYGHMQTYKHQIDEGGGLIRNITPTEAFRIQGYSPARLNLGDLSKRQ